MGLKQLGKLCLKMAILDQVVLTTFLDLNYLSAQNININKRMLFLYYRRLLWGRNEWTVWALCYTVTDSDGNIIAQGGADSASMADLRSLIRKL